MAYKYKLNEMSKTASPKAAEEATGIPPSKQEVGKVTFSKDGDTKYTVTNVNPETGQVSWKVETLPAFDKLLDDADELITTSRGVYTKTKSDEKFREFFEEAKILRNKIRKHLRNEYPDEYKRIQMFGEGEVDEISLSGAAGAYNTPFAFRKKGSKPNVGALTKLGYKLVKKDKEDVNEAFVVLHSPKKGKNPQVTAAYKDREDAEKWAKSLGGITQIVQRKVKGIDEGTCGYNRDVKGKKLKGPGGLGEGDTYEKMAAKGKKAGNLKQGTVRKRLGIKKGEKIPLSLINKELARMRKMDKDKDKKGVQLGDKNQKYYKALQLSKTLKTTTNVNEERFGGQIMPGDYVKNQHGNIYQRVDGKVGRHDAYVRVINGKSGKKKIGLHDSFKLTLVNKDELKENVKVGDILTKDGKKGKVVKVMDDMANVDFGGGDVYGITFRRIKGNKIVNEEKAITFRPGTLDDMELSTRILDKEGIKYRINNYDLILSDDDYLVVLDYLKGRNNVNVNLSNSIINENNKNPGAILGPGPKAGPDGVTDNYYVKAYKYKLVPKTKDGTYVQKGSGLDVKKLF